MALTLGSQHQGFHVFRLEFEGLVKFISIQQTFLNIHSVRPVLR